MKYEKLSPDNFWCFTDWDYEKNGDLRPENFTLGSAKSVWWICVSGHRWKDKIINRAKGTGCPYDSGRRKLPPNPSSNIYVPVRRIANLEHGENE